MNEHNESQPDSRSKPRIVEKSNCIAVELGGAVVANFAGPECRRHAELFASALQPDTRLGEEREALDMDRVLLIADEHSLESNENGTRLFDRYGLVDFAAAITRAALSAPPASHAAQGGAQKLEFGGRMQVKPDYSDLSRQALEAHAARMAQLLEDNRPIAFHRRHAVGSLAAPSCLCCGKLPEEVAVKHMELPNIVICKKCHALATAPAQAGEAEPVGEVVELSNGEKHLRWATLKFPPTGTKLYATPPTSSPEDKTQAARDVLAERARQISAEGWTPEHDDQHDDGVMALAAAGYAHAAFWNEFEPKTAFTSEEPPPGWPDEWDFKPADARRMLVKAAALCLAEVERRDRAAIDSARSTGKGE